MKQQRSVGYLVAEGYFLLQWRRARKEGDRDSDEFKALAADVARRRFSTTRPLGNWDYYELMEKVLESGVFDRLPGGAVDPETDESTYNGRRWKLARERFWANPDVAPATTSAEYQRALAAYAAEAVRDDYRWSWRDAQLQKDVYAQTILSANRRYQYATSMFGLVVANHLSSLIDSYVSLRVRRFGGVRVGGMQFDGLRSSVRIIGDPRDGRLGLATGLRFVPSRD